MAFRILFLSILSIFTVAPALVQAQPTTREMNLRGWQEFGDLVPEQVATVLIPTGTLEPHGVLPNGSDNLAPEAMARELAERLNALIAPTLNYGVTDDLDAFPGTFSIAAGLERVPVSVVDHPVPGGSGISGLRSGQGRDVLSPGQRPDGGADRLDDRKVGPGWNSSVRGALSWLSDQGWF